MSLVRIVLNLIFRFAAILKRNHFNHSKRTFLQKKKLDNNKSCLLSLCYSFDSYKYYFPKCCHSI